jgi:hypothetical protein
LEADTSRRCSKDQETKKICESSLENSLPRGKLNEKSKQIYTKTRTKNSHLDFFNERNKIAKRRDYFVNQEENQNTYK